MGTLGLIFGIIGIGIAVSAIVYGLSRNSSWTIELEASVGITLISGAIGYYFIMRYKDDKKKEKISEWRFT